MKEVSDYDKYRANEYWELSGISEAECPPPYPELLHAHEWDPETWFCVICGADGNA